MVELKEIRKRAWQSLKGHYWIFVAACLLAAILGTEYANTLHLLRILTLLDTILSSKKLSVILLAFLGFSLSVLFWLFISNVYRVAYCRVFLEGRLYAKIPFSRFVFLYRIKKHVKASLSMAMYMLLNYLWLFTIVMFPVKRYAYLLAPYLVAENPDLSPLEAVRLSQRMMKGHKWEAFLMELSLLPWTLLSIVTGGMCASCREEP